MIAIYKFSLLPANPVNSLKAGSCPSDDNFVQICFCPFLSTLKCLSIGTHKAINFPFVSNEKLMFLGVPVFKHIVMRL